MADAECGMITGAWCSRNRRCSDAQNLDALAESTGGLIGTNRLLSLVPVWAVCAADFRKIDSNRNIKISANIDLLPSSAARNV